MCIQLFKHAKTLERCFLSSFSHSFSKPKNYASEPYCILYYLIIYFYILCFQYYPSTPCSYSFLRSLHIPLHSLSLPPSEKLGPLLQISPQYNLEVRFKKFCLMCVKPKVKREGKRRCLDLVFFVFFF